MGTIINVADLLNDPDLCEPFTITRNPGQFAAGGWQGSGPTTFNAYGAVRNATGKELDMVPEGDRVHEMISFRSVTPMYMTDEAQSITSDILTWHGQKYRVVFSKDYTSQGYTLAIAARMLGS